MYRTTPSSLYNYKHLVVTHTLGITECPKLCVQHIVWWSLAVLLIRPSLHPYFSLTSLIVLLIVCQLNILSILLSPSIFTWTRLLRLKC